MAAVGTAYVDVKADLKGFDSEVEKSGKGLAGKFGKWGKDAGKALAVGFGAAVVGGAIFAKGAIDAASDLNESMSKVQVVFGDSAKSVIDFSKTAATGLGQSQAQALAATGTFGNLLRALGLTTTQSADMSTQMVQLATDLASFNNTDPAVALDALRSGLTGETEPLKQFGVNMNDATLKAEALKLGLISSTKDAMDPATKAMAAYQLIMDQTALSQGDFDRTSQGLANQQRILKARFDDLKATIGTALLPVAVSLITFLNEKAIPALEKYLPAAIDTVTAAIGPLVTEWLPQARDRIGEIYGWFIDHPQVVDTFVASIRAIGENIGPMLPTLAALVASLAAVNVTLTAINALSAAKVSGAILDLLGPVGELIGGLFKAHPVLAAIVLIVAALAAGFYVLYTKVEPFRDAVEATGRALSGAFKDSIDWLVNTAWPVLKTALDDMKLAFWTVALAVGDVAGIFEDVGSAITDTVAPAIDAIGEAIGKLGPVFRGVGRTILAALGPTIDWFSEHVAPTFAAAVDLIAAIWERLKDVTLFAWNALALIVLPILDIIGATISATFGLIVGIVRDAMLLITPYVQMGWAEIQSVVTAVMGVLASVIGPAWSAIAQTIGTTMDFIVQILQETWALVSTIIGAALDIIRGIIQVFTGILTLDWSTTWEGIRTIIQGVWDAIVIIVQTVTGVIQSIIEAALGLLQTSVETAWALITGLINSAWEGIKGIVQTAIGEVVGFMAEMPGKILEVLAGVPDLLLDMGKRMVEGFKQAASDAWDRIKVWFGDLPHMVQDAVGDLANALVNIGREMAQGFWNGFKSAWNFVADHATVTAPSVDVPFLGTIGGWTLSLLPHLAKGGLLDMPTLFVGGEYAGASSNPEIVSPVSTMRAAFRAELGAFPNGYGNDGAASPVINVYLGNELITDHVDARIEYANGATVAAARAGVR